MQEKNASTELRRTGGCTLQLEVDAAEDCALFTTIPAEEGWTVTIDGVQTDWKTCLSGSLICVPVTQGKHTIVLNFYPAGLAAGLILSGSGLVLLAAMLVGNNYISVIDRKKREKRTAEQSEE